MKPTLRKVTLNPESSFSVRKDEGINLINNWHYHPELELLLMRKTAGTLIVGDRVENFLHNDVIFIGPNLPHTFVHEGKYLSKTTKRDIPEAIVIHFHQEFFGNEFMALPELHCIRHVLSVSNQGLKINCKAKKAILPLLSRIVDSPPIDRLLILFEILKTISFSGSYTLLASKGFVSNVNKSDECRINSIYNYTFENYQSAIKIEEVAAKVNLTKESFCRYFKEKTHKTYTEFLMELRIGQACRLLIEEDLSIKEIAYSCGYNNISNFHHQFKKIKNKSPREFRNDLLNI